MTKLLTSNASQDDLTSETYREIFEELRGDGGLRRFCAMVGEPEHRIAWWSKYARRIAELGPDEQNVLRRAVGKPPRPSSVQEIADTSIDPDASIWLVGEPQPASRVVLVSQPGPVSLHLDDSTVTANFDQPGNFPTQGNVTGVTRKRRRSPAWRPWLPEEWRLELEKRGLSLREIVEQAINEHQCKA